MTHQKYLLTQMQYSQFVRLGCRFRHGYLFVHPLPSDLMHMVLAASRGST